MTEINANSLGEFAQALGSELSQTDTTIFNNRFGAVTLNRSLLSTLYLEHGIIQVLIDQPVDDAFRGGITIRSEELSADDLKQLHHKIDMMDLIQTYGQALKWTRLFGGAGIIINAGQDMTKEFNINGIGPDTPLEFYAADRWEMSYTPAGMSNLDQFSQEKLTTPYNYYGHVLHKTNVIKLMGKIAPSLIRGQFGGWGVSEIEKILRSWNQYVKHQSVSFELLDEAKVDVFKIQGFNSAIASRNGAQLTAQRVNLAAQIKDYRNALVVDKEDDYEAKQLSFSGLSEILKEIRIGLACDLRMPMTKLFGLSASGFNSGEDDIENYNCMIESEVRSKAKQGLLLMLKILCQKEFGYVPETIDFDFKPLREMSSQEESALKNDRLNRVMTAFERGLMSAEVAVSQLNSEEVFPVELKADDVDIADMDVPRGTNEADGEEKDA
jgi:phage-related protein (TIGR01555 family)